MRKILVGPNGGIHQLPMWVAQREGFFAEEGFDVEFTKLDKADAAAWQEVDWEQANAIIGGTKERLLTQGQSQVYNACEWGCIVRAEAHQRGAGVAAKIIQKRPVAFAHTLLVRGDSDIYLPEDLANRPIGVSWPNGNYFMAFRMLEGYIPFDQIRVVNLGIADGARSWGEALLSGQVDGLVIFEPFTSWLEKRGARMIVEGFDRGEEVGVPDMDAETRAKWTRAIQKAVQAINTNRLKYLAWIVEEDLPGEIDPAEVRWSRVHYLMPSPYTKQEFERAYGWMVERKMIHEGVQYEDLVFAQ